MLNADGCLHVQRSLQMRGNLINRWRCSAERRQCRCCRRRLAAIAQALAKSRVVNYIGLLVHSIFADALEHIAFGEAVIEPAIASADHGFCLLARTRRSPRKGQPWRPIAVVADPILCLVAKAVAQRKVLTCLIVILEK